jgi:hypothetical protein
MHGLGIGQALPANRPYGRAQFALRDPLLQHGLVAWLAIQKQLRRLCPHEPCEGRPPHRQPGDRKLEKNQQQKGKYAPAEGCVGREQMLERVDPIATVMTRSKAFSLESVRLPVRRRKKTRAT